MSQAPRIPNMADVAARAGVSHQTVWRAINGRGNVSEATRERILAVVDELGYRPNLSARRLVTRRSRIIGVLAPGTPNFGPTSSLYAVEREIRAAGYHPLISSVGPDEAEARESVDMLLDQSVEALVAIAPHRSTLLALEALQPLVPTVLLQAGAEAAGASVAVTVDQQAGVAAIVAHLVDLGHRRIQHIAGPSSFIEAGLRQSGFTAEIAQRGLAELPVLDGDWSAESGYRAGLRIDPTATAVFVSNDQMAVGVLHALSTRGVAVPGELSVVGFDDVPESAHSLPPLTTVHQDFAAIGRRAVAALLQRIDPGAIDGGESGDASATDDAAVEPARAVVLTPELVVRESTAPPPAR